MQGKGIVKFFLVVMVLVSLLQLFYNVPTSRVESTADEVAMDCFDSTTNENDQRQAANDCRTDFLDSMMTEPILSLPFLGVNYNYQDLKSRQLAYGLDLKGGVSLVLQVNLRDMIRVLADDSKDPTFIAALDQATEELKNAQADYVSLFVDAWQDQANGKPLAPLFQRNQTMREDNINLESSDGEVALALRDRANETVRLTYQLLRERIDALGVVQPNISLDAARDMILVELPGISNPSRAIDMTEPAKLEFWNVYRLSDAGIIDAFSKANDKLRTESGQDIALDSVPLYALDSLGQTDSSRIVGYQPAGLNLDSGPLFSKLNLSRGERGFAVFGTAAKNQRDDVMDILNREDITRLFPQDAIFRFSQNPVVDIDGNRTNDYELYVLRKERGSDEAPLIGDVVVNARQDLDPNNGNQVVVSLTMNADGAKTWARLTTAAAADNQREVAIVLDDEVVSAPSVNSPITGGRSQITGNYTVQEAQDFASILEVGRLPADIDLVQYSIVGPSLGAANIRSSTISLAVGFALVLLFMVLYYGTSGIFSIVALLLNLFFIYGALASLGTVLTLPGIAGIVLTIGMAVDANVIIYERIREELREGKALQAAIADGFRNSYSAIIDANVTTLLVAGVLVYFGFGPIKGFAVVLAVGVISSVFTAVLVGRMMIEWWVNKGNNVSFWTGASKNAFANLKIDWLGKRKVAYMISGAIIALGIVSMIARGFDLGVDFSGGYSYNIEFAGDAPSADQLRDALTPTFGGNEPIVKAVDTDNTYNVVTKYNIESSDDNAQDVVMDALYAGVNSLGNVGINNAEQFKAPDGLGTHVSSSTKVGATIADDIRSSSVYAAIFALLGIFLYIFLRFSRWQYSAGAVAALFHDVAIVLSLFSIGWGILPFAMEIDQAFIAALLTVIGYSINDTVVVFDRIREFMNTYTQKGKEEIINMAINSTVSRTVITSLTTLFVVAILFVFGGGSIRGFAFALLVGIIVGTYSSIFIATPVMSDLTGDLKTTKKKTETSKTSFSQRAAAARAPQA